MKKIKRILFLAFLLTALLACLMFHASAAEAVEFGFCGGEGDGTNLSWTLDSEGTLTISGSGKMANYKDYNVPWVSYRKSIKTAIIGNSVTTIGSYGFHACDSLTSVTIPDSVTSIGGWAFWGCDSLTSVTIPDSVASIGSSAFRNCDSLTSVTIPDSVTSIGELAFADSIGLTSLAIPDSVTHIGKIAFEGCTGLTSVTIGNSVTSLGERVFANCIRLTSLTIPDSVTSIGRRAFSCCHSLTSVTIPDSVTTIGDEAFYWCSGLTSVSIPASVTTINGGAFEDCDRLTGVYITDLAAWCKIKFGSTAANPLYYAHQLFLNGTLIQELTIPDSVTTIGACAFAGCNSLTSVTIGDNVTGIGAYAFCDCDGLTSVTIPDSVTSIGGCAFFGGTGLTSVYFMGNGPQVTASASGVRYPSFNRETVTLYYIPGMTGWTDSPYYDAEAGTWNGYKLAIWGGPSDYRITPVAPDDIVINGKGYGVANFRMTDYANNPIAKEQVIVDGKTTVLTDDNGVFSIWTTWADYAEKYGAARSGPVDLSMEVEFSLPAETEQELHNGKQTIHYRLTPAIFTQEWEGYVAKGGSIGLGLGIGSAIGVASAEINIIGAEAGLSAGSGLKVTYDHTATGQDLTLTHTDRLDGNYGFKSGIQATALTVNMALYDASAGSTLTSLRSTGLKIPNYNPLDLNQQKQVGHFLLQCYLMGSRSVADQQLLNQLLNAGHNMSAAGQKVLLEAGATAGRVEVLQGSEVGLGQEKLTAEAALVMEYEKAESRLNHSVTYTTGIKTDYGAGLDKGGWLNDSNTVSTSGTADYRRGMVKTNSVSVSTWSQGFADLFGASYTFYKEGELDFGSLERTDVATQITFEKEAAEAIVAANEDFRELHAGKKAAFSAKELLAVGDYILESDQPASVAEISNRKKGISLNFPVALEILGELGLNVSAEFMATTSHEQLTGVKVGTEIYTTAESALTDSDIKAQEIALLDILNDPVEATVYSLFQKFITTLGKVVDGVTNGYAAVTGALSDFWVEVRTNPGILAQSESYAILAVAEEDVPDSDAAVAVTLGEPYLVSVYKDETKETPVSEEEMAANPVTLTLSYTADMLYAAGVTPDANLYIYRFDGARNLYVCLTDSVQDKAAMAVTVPVTKHGEYILATDNASPLVSDFAVSNGTATPKITALVSDLSGIGEFSFRLDEGEVLVDEDTLKTYYDPATGIFTYAVTEPLSAGEHTAYFTACDKLGNATAEPFAFTFTVDTEAPVITAVTMPTDTVTDAQGFTVTACVTETEDLAGVALVVNGGQTVSFPMEQDESGLWTAQVKGIAGLTSAEIYVTATDFAGNQARSEKQTVTIAIPGTTKNIVLTPGERKGNQVTVTAENRDIGAASGWLVCAAYDENGKMLGLGTQYVDLQGKDTKSFELTLNCKSDQVAKLKAFLLGGTTRFPLHIP